MIDMVFSKILNLFQKQLFFVAMPRNTLSSPRTSRRLVCTAGIQNLVQLRCTLALDPRSAVSSASLFGDDASLNNDGFSHQWGRQLESGNVFFALFGAVAMVGVLGVAIMTFMSGPLTTSVKLTKINSAENQMAVGARVAVMAASSQSNSGDCDSDGYVEPVEWRAAVTEPHPTNGGLIPLTLGMSKKDPWGTEYGYCVWNHGSVTSAAGCGTNMLAGTTSHMYPVVAIVSAGPDKAFTTTCRTYAAADVNSDGDLLDAADLKMVSKAANSDDDIIFTYTYEEATGASGGLWNLKSNDPNTATIAKDIEVSGDAAVSGSGSFSGGVVLPDASLITCDASLTGVMARNASGTGLEICDGAAWQAITGGASTGSMQMADDTVNTACNVGNVGLMRYNTSGTTGDRDVSSVADIVTTGGTTYSTPAIVQTSTVGKLTAPPGSVSRSFATTPTAGNTVIVTFSQYDNGSATPDSFTVTDNQGGTYTLANSHYYYDSGYSDLGASYIYYRSNITAPSPSTYTVTITGTSQFSMQIMEVSGLATSSVIDGNGTGIADINDTPLTVTSASTTTQAKEIAVSTYMTISGSSGLAITTASSGWTVGGVNNSGSSQVAYGMATNILSSVSQPSVTWTASNTSGTRSVGVISTFKALATASGPQNTVTTTVSTTKSYSNYTEICNGSSWVTVGSGVLNDLTDSADNYTGTGDAATSQSTYSMFLGSGSGGGAAAGATLNTGLGYRSLVGLVNGDYQTAMGRQAARTNATGLANSVFGSNAYYSGTGSSNSAFGYHSAFDTAAGIGNTIFGNMTFYSNKAGNYSVALGNLAMRYANSSATGFTTGNTAVGYQSLKGSAVPASNTGTNNTAIGVNALVSNVDGSDNTAFGSRALYANQSGARNSACGKDSLYNNTTGTDNTACGYQAAYGNTVANFNVAMGSGALYTNKAQSGQVALGYHAMYYSSPSLIAADAYDTVVGYNAMAGNAAITDTGYNAVMGANALLNASAVTSIGNVAVGSGALHDNADVFSAGKIGFGYNAGYSNADEYIVAFGAEAMRYAYSGVTAYRMNTAVGYQALMGSATPINNTGDLNVAVGYQALKNNTSGSNNTAIGAGAAVNVNTGSDNVGIGYNAMYGVSTGGRNVAVGGSSSTYGVLYSINGDDNVVVGNNALSVASGTCSGNVVAGEAAMYGVAGNCGSNNVAIGNKALYASTTGANNVAIGGYAGSGLYYTGAAEAASGTAVTTESNNTFIGYNTQLNGAGFTNGTAIGNGALIYASNTITLGNTAITGIYAQVTSITAISDRRHKKDIQDADLGLAFINTLHPVSYRFNNGDDTLRYGFIAQEVEKSLPDKLKPLVDKENGLALVTRQNNEEKTYRVNYFELIAPLVKAVQELDKKIDGLIAKLDGFVAETTTQLAALLDGFAQEDSKGKVQSDKLDKLDKDLKGLEEKLAVAK